MTTTFNYTTHKVVDSSAVDQFWYDENAQTLAVDLHDEIYVYSGVKAVDFTNLSNAQSVGREFAPFKRTHGPSRYLGDIDDVRFVESTKTQGSLSRRITLGVAPATGGVVGTTAPTPKPAAVKRSHEVVFSVGAYSVEKSYTLDATSVDEAVEALREVSNVLGVAVTVKRVVVNFA